MTDYPERLNVLWLVDHLGYDGFMHGAGKYYLNTIPLINKSKFDVTLCVLRKKDNLTKLFEDQGIRIHHLGRGKFDPLTLLDLIKLVKEEKINLIHAHGYGAANFGRLAGVLTGVRTIVHAHDDDRNYPLYQKFADHLLSGSTDKAIAISESVKESCVRKRRIKEDKLSVMHNGIPLGNFSAVEEERIQKERNRLGVQSGVKVVGTIARLREEKGTRYLIESAPMVLEAFPETLFLIVGDGPLREELESLSRQLGVDRSVIFAGFCQDIPAILSIFDIAVIPSLTEGSSVALLEEMAMGKPIIATSVGGIKEVLIEGETGLFVSSKDSKALAERIIYLLKDEDEARRLGMKAKEESKKYDINLYVKRLEEHYSELLSQN